VGIVDVLLGAKDFEEFTTNWDVLRSISRNDVKLVRQLNSARAEAKAAHAQLAVKEKKAELAKKEMSNQQNAAYNALAESKRKKAGIEAEIAQIEAAEEAAARARAAASERAAAAARAAARVAYAPAQQSFPAPTRAPRSEVVAIAKRYLGAPYVWAASGPNSFDCSGFTMFVYRQVGVSLPHSSAAQIGCGQRVSRADLQAGDLDFFGSPIHHVGIYVGGGAYIHAPSSGDVVKISALDRGDYAGACRP
jgi:cell wall-associated NlpC family hydrolase